MMAFAVMNVTTIVSLRGLPAQAEYGLTSIFYYVFAAVVFLVPTALVAAELAAAFPKQGGVFRWVGEAFGRVGLRRDLLPVAGDRHLVSDGADLWRRVAGLYVVAGKLRSGSGRQQALYDRRSARRLLVCHAFTFRGIEASSRLSSLGGLFGTIIPGAILIVLGGIYVAMGNPIQMHLNAGFLPDFSNFHNMVLAAGVFLFFAGMEMQAVHVRI